MWGVTDEEVRRGKRKSAHTYPKIRRSHIATVIKLADRIANVEENVRTANVEGFLKYKREHVELERRVRDLKSVMLSRCGSISPGSFRTAAN